ncbi:hypothetical protein Pth03_76060 [Planotetraspora thailandica]|uniref:Uncharacterized protein n=1 Tax=Planotetraspora thailandica TaxID=487172 RepID=A0A8J3Y1W1_9ACTN|nr:hypothetical protein [Planotetraspora thailandica]GII59217.1 hypothetical protein Pth03_76060 [Planotetraspora thailandica]
MALYLIELATRTSARSRIEAAVVEVGLQAAASGGELIESRVAADLSRVEPIAEAAGLGPFRVTDNTRTFVCWCSSARTGCVS